MCIEWWSGVYTCVLSKSCLCASGDPPWGVLPSLHGDLSAFGQRISVRHFLHFALRPLLAVLLSGQSDRFHWMKINWNSHHLMNDDPPCPSVIWSERGGELSEETLSSPVLPSRPLRFLLSRLWLLSVRGHCPRPQSHLHALLQPLPTLHLCQRHCHLRAAGLPTSPLCPTSYQTGKVLPRMRRYFWSVKTWNHSGKCVASVYILNSIIQKEEL